MNGAFHVVWAAVAERDLQGIIDYIALNNPANAMQVLKKIRKKASTLQTSPERGRIVPELQAQGIQFYRELVVPPWRVIYRISDKTVSVLSVLSVIDARRNIEDILLGRLAGVITY